MVLEATAYLMPLLLALQESAPVGVVAVWGDGVRVVEIRGAATESPCGSPSTTSAPEWRRLQGPAGANPARQRQVSSQADLTEHGTAPIRELVGPAPATRARPPRQDRGRGCAGCETSWVSRSDAGSRVQVKPARRARLASPGARLAGLSRCRN